MEQDEIAVAEKPSPVAEYTATEAALADLRSRLKDVVHDVATTKGMEAAKKDRAEVRGLRVALEAKRVEIKAPALERCRLIDAEAKRITEALIELEKPIDAQIKAEEKRKADEKAAKEDAERKRVAAIRARIDDIGAAVLRFIVVKRSGDIAAAIASLELVEIDGSFAEFAAEAEGVKQGTIAKLHEMLAAAEAQEAEAKRLAEQRAELARQEKEAAERRAAERRAQEEEAARIRAEQEAEAARLKAEREAFERQQAEARRKAEEERAEADRKAAAEREKADRIAREAREAEERRIAAERAELERQRAEQEARERAERERREAEESERARREYLAALKPPTAEEIVEMVSDKYAGGDCKKAADWLSAIDFVTFAKNFSADEVAA